MSTAASLIAPALRVDDVEAWFAGRGWSCFDFQREVWAAYRDGESGLVHSPTGTGKTLAAWFAALLAHAGTGGGDPAPPTVLWITPLRALALDTHRTLQESARELGVSWTVGLRTGDTAAAERKRQLARLPSALVTTPESLSLLLSHERTARALRAVQAVVVDEWHELLGSKRGVQLELCLARLRAARPALRVWGLSATIGNLTQAAGVLLGPGRPARIVHGDVGKASRITGVLPPDIQRFPWAGHVGIQMVPAVVEIIEGARTSLLFTNTRSQAERWFEALLRARPDWLGTIALHHGSLDPSIRSRVEDLLRRGELRCVVATSSLDLGVDFSPVERVLQVGSPKGVARLLQRAGRSGHQPGAVSEVFCVPTQALELVEIAAARDAAGRARIEARRPLRLCLDVLCQHLVTLSLAGGVDPDAVLAEARGTHAFSDLGDETWQWVLDFLIRGGPALNAYPQFKRLVRADGLLEPASHRIAAHHRMAIGTITSDSSMRVQYLSGRYLGMVEESFISRLRPGDAFHFAGRTLELVRVRDMAAYVKRSTRRRAAVPRWSGGRMPLSNELGAAMLDQLQRFRDDRLTAPEMDCVAPLLALQARMSRVPAADELLVERARSRDGVSLFLYPFDGRLVHEGLAALLAWRLSRLAPITFSYAVNDYGIELLSADEVPFDADRLRAALTGEALVEDVSSAINASEMARRQFRDIARVAGLVFQGYPGARKTARQVQASSGLIFDVLERYDAGNELLAQAHREVLDAQFQLDRMRASLERLAGQRLVLVDTERLSPLALPLWAERTRARVSSETWLERVLKMQRALAGAAPGDGGD